MALHKHKPRSTLGPTIRTPKKACFSVSNSRAEMKVRHFPMEKTELGILKI